MTTKKLLSCPFCGSEAGICSVTGEYYMQYFVYCKSCGCEGKPSDYESQAIANWNTRAMQQK